MHAQNIELTDMPARRPYKSFMIPMSHGPNIPPNPPNAKKIPSIIPECWKGISEMNAVDVGKIMEKQNPVSDRIIAVSGEPNIPIVMQKNAIIEKIDRLFRYPVLSTNRLPNNLPAVIPAKYRERYMELAVEDIFLAFCRKTASHEAMPISAATYENITKYISRTSILKIECSISSGLIFPVWRLKVFSCGNSMVTKYKIIGIMTNRLYLYTVRQEVPRRKRILTRIGTIMEPMP